MKPALKYYLASYNLAALLFWAAYFVCFIASGFRITSVSLILLNIAQGLALLEVLHAALKWVRSPILSTIAQVASRILVLVLIDIFIRDESLYAPLFIGITMVSIAWSVTEVIRYSLYFLSLFDIEWRWLVWARYSFFIVLYPLGVTGEWFIITAPISAHGISLSPYTVFVGFLLVSYIYYFPVLYKYMWKQRKNKL